MVTDHSGNNRVRGPNWGHPAFQNDQQANDGNNGSREPNVIGNEEELEEEQEEVSGSRPNVGSPSVRMQAQQPLGLSSAVHAARMRQANARASRVSDFSAA